MIGRFRSEAMCWTISSRALFKIERTISIAQDRPDRPRQKPLNLRVCTHPVIRIDRKSGNRSTLGLVHRSIELDISPG